MKLRHADQCETSGSWASMFCPSPAIAASPEQCCGIFARNSASISSYATSSESTWLGIQVSLWIVAGGFDGCPVGAATRLGQQGRQGVQHHRYPDGVLPA